MTRSAVVQGVSLLLAAGAFVMAGMALAAVRSPLGDGVPDAVVTEPPKGAPRESGPAVAKSSSGAMNIVADSIRTKRLELVTREGRVFLEASEAPAGEGYPFLRMLVGDKVAVRVDTDAGNGRITVRDNSNGRYVVIDPNDRREPVRFKD